MSEAVHDFTINDAYRDHPGQVNWQFQNIQTQQAIRDQGPLL